MATALFGLDPTLQRTRRETDHLLYIAYHHKMLNCRPVQLGIMLQGGELHAWLSKHFVRHPICRVSGSRLHRKRHVLVQLATRITQCPLHAVLSVLSLDQSRFLLYKQRTYIRSNRNSPFFQKTRSSISLGVSDDQRRRPCTRSQSLFYAF